MLPRRDLPEDQRLRLPYRVRVFWIVVLVLLTVNWLSVLISHLH
jgi:hypothetical protein